MMLAGRVLTLGSVAMLIGACLPDARVFTSADGRVRMEAIAGRRWGWRAQGVMFPASFAIVALGEALAAASMRAGGPRRLAGSGAALGALAAALWTPIALRRNAIGSDIDEILSDEARVDATDIGGATFWPYTWATLASIACLGGALAWSSEHRRVGNVAAALATAGLAAGKATGDWPPFMSYLITLGLGIAIGRES